MWWGWCGGMHGHQASKERERRGVRDGRVDVEWKGLKTKVRRVDTQLMSKFVMLCFVRTQEF